VFDLSLWKWIELHAYTGRVLTTKTGSNRTYVCVCGGGGEGGPTEKLLVGAEAR